MSERPILFSAEMVKAILERRKTQTRRAIRIHPPYTFKLSSLGMNEAIFGAVFEDANGTSRFVRCPYAADILWVREIWNAVSYDDDQIYYSNVGRGEREHMLWKPIYKASCEHDKWISSIFMPRWASRIKLKLNSITVERVQDITEESAIAEGVETDDYLNFVEWAGMVGGCTRDNTVCDNFRELWDKINLKRGYGWDENPFVWVLEFEVK